MILVVLAIIFANILNSLLGFVLTLGAIVVIFLQPGRSGFERILTSLIVTMPLYTLPVIEPLHHSLSWTTGFLTLLMIHAGSHIRRVTPLVFVTLAMIVSLPVMAAVFVQGDAPYYISQFLLFIVPAATVFVSREWAARQLDVDSQRRVIDTLLATIMAMGLGVLVQAGLHQYAGVTLGSVSYFKGRVSYDLTMNAYSVLSVLLAMGFALAPSLLSRGKWPQALALGAVSGVAILINSSRAGLVVGSVILFVALMFPAERTGRRLSRVFLIPFALLLMGLYEQYLASSRGTISLFDDNGRMETFMNALDALQRDGYVLLFGAGMGRLSEGAMAPHNFAVETLLQFGIIVSVALMVLLFGLLKFLWGSEWQYPAWALLAGSMVFAGFYAVKAAAVIVIVMVVLQEASMRVAGDRGGNSNGSASKANRLRAPLTSSMRLSLTRGARTGTAPAAVVTSRAW